MNTIVISEKIHNALIKSGLIDKDGNWHFTPEDELKQNLIGWYNGLPVYRKTELLNKIKGRCND